MRTNRSLVIGAVGLAAASTLTTLGGAAAADLIDGSRIVPHSIAVGKLTPEAVERLRGQQGPEGPRGRRGPNGLNGENGAPGVAGPAGPLGPSGAAGPPGPIGPAGVAGPAGAAGAPGAAGSPGTQGPAGTGATSTPEPAGANCQYGGFKLTSASGTSYVCNGGPGQTGTPGQGVSTSPEPAGANCPNGGVKLTSTSGVNYVCNGAPALPKLTSRGNGGDQSTAGTLSAAVYCPAGAFALGGGGISSADLAMVLSEPINNNPPTGLPAPIGWQVEYSNPDHVSATVSAEVVCTG